MPNRVILFRLFILLLLLTEGSLTVWAAERFPCLGTTTTTLNVRTGPGVNYGRSGRLSPGTQVRVLERVSPEWVRIDYGTGKSYVNSRYLTLTPYPPKASPQTDSEHWRSSYSFWSGVWNLVAGAISLFCFWIVLRLLLRAWQVASVVFTVLFRVVSIPFFWLNTLQRYLAKPWLPFVKTNRLSDDTKEIIRHWMIVVQIPLYILLLPLRFANAVFFNLIVHCWFESFNYLMEVVDPSEDNEGAYDTWKKIYMTPWRILKYPIWHGTLTFIESLVWTVADTFLPALTLFHGTSQSAAWSIVSSPNRGEYYQHNTGLWIVGKGNYVGDGIYFAPARRTALHYADGSLIISRVTLGKTLDLALAPDYVFNACGNANAHVSTSWGLRNGYVTGEWWRYGTGWWEYCMYDWQNRYNYSWRIRPLYVIDLESGGIQRIPGGMSHWLFRKIVIQDIYTSLTE